MEDELLEKFLEQNGGKSESDIFLPIPAKEIQLNRIQGICKRISENGTSLVISHYGTLANAVAGDPPANADIMEEGVRTIHKGLKNLYEDISVHGNEVEKFSPEEILKLRRSLAVMVFLAHRALSGMEAKSVQESLGSNDVAGKKSKKKTTTAVQYGESFDLKNMRAILIEDLLKLLDVPVENIWDDTGYGFSLPRLLIRTICSNLNETYLAKDNLQAGPAAYKILGIVAKRFNKHSEVNERLFTLVKQGEDVAKLVTRAIEVMVTEYELVETVPSALRAALELWESTGQKNVNVEKGIAVLISDLCENTPTEVVVKSTRSLIQFLNVDSCSIRNAVLFGASLLLRWLNSVDGKGPGGKKMRVLLLEDMLLRHTKDNNALVRSKAMNLVSKLIDEKELEPPEVAECMKSMIPRILDIAVLTRKYSVSMVSIIIGKFPAIVNETINLKEDVRISRKRLLQLLGRNAHKNSHFVLLLVQEFIDQVQESPIPLPQEYEVNLEAGMDSVREVITKLVTEENYWDACTILYHAFEKYSFEVGIQDAGKSAAIPFIYMSYFKRITCNEDEDDVDSTDDVLNLSQFLNSEENQTERRSEPEEIIKAKKLLYFARGCESMSRMVDSLITNLVELLRIGTKNDKMEVIAAIGDLVNSGYSVNDKISGPVIQAIADVGKESAGTLLPAFWSIFIGDKDIRNVSLIRNLFSVLQTVPTTVKDLLQPIIEEMYAKGALSNEATMILWDAFTGRYNWTKEDSRNAVFVLGVLARHDKNVLLLNLTCLIETGLGDQAFEDMIFVKYTCEAILFAFLRSKKGESDVLDTTRFKPDHILFTRVVALLEHGLTHKGDSEACDIFPRVAELAVQIIYKLSWDPHVCAQRVLVTVTSVFKDGKSNMKDTEEICLRFLSILSSLLGANINYYETTVIPEIRRRKAVASPTKPVSTSRRRKASNTSKSSVDQSLNSRSNSRSSNTTRDSSLSSTVNAEMEAMIGNAGFDTEQEIIRNYIEKLLDEGTFRELRTLTLFCCRKITSMKNKKLQLATVQALAKLMSVSSTSVVNHVQPFINLWLVDSPFVKVEIIKQLTILYVRFPNQMEQCNTIIEQGLNSNFKEVKVACLDCMGYLALGDLVKVRDNIAQVALCLCDNEPDIKEMAKDFFVVCAEKDNIISNAVPEVISCLSNKSGLSQVSFQSIMKFLLVRVKKEKQVIGLVDTLIGRFKGPAQSDRLSQDTAFCLAQLSHGEKSFKILRENIHNYSNKLDDELVFRSFSAIIEALRKTVTKPDVKLKLDDFERELEERHQKCVEKKRIAGVAARQADGNISDRGSSSGDESSLMEKSVNEGNTSTQVQN